MADLARIPEEHYTYTEYKQWQLDEGERYELIEGEPHMMSAPNDQHQAISLELSRQFANFLRGKPCKLRVAPYDVRLFYEEDESDDTVVQPDLSVICEQSKLGEEGCRGAPDMVIEILSPSNSNLEMFRKVNLYMSAGVREYWVVDGATKTVIVYIFEGEGCRLFRHTAEKPLEAGILPGLAINLADVFAQ